MAIVNNETTYCIMVFCLQRSEVKQTIVFALVYDKFFHDPICFFFAWYLLYAKKKPNAVNVKPNNSYCSSSFFASDVLVGVAILFVFWFLYDAPNGRNTYCQLNQKLTDCRNFVGCWESCRSNCVCTRYQQRTNTRSSNGRNFFVYHKANIVNLNL